MTNSENITSPSGYVVCAKGVFEDLTAPKDAPERFSGRFDLTRDGETHDLWLALEEATSMTEAMTKAVATAKRLVAWV